MLVEGEGGKEGFEWEGAQVHGSMLSGEVEDEGLEGGEVGQGLLIVQVLHLYYTFPNYHHKQFLERYGKGWLRMDGN